MIYVECTGAGHAFNKCKKVYVVRNGGIFKEQKIAQITVGEGGGKYWRRWVHVKSILCLFYVSEYSASF